MKQISNPGVAAHGFGLLCQLLGRAGQQQASAAAEEVDASVRMVAQSSQQMSTSIREVSQGTHEAVTVGATAMRMAGEANTTIRQLGESSEQIDNPLFIDMLRMRGTLWFLSFTAMLLSPGHRKTPAAFPQNGQSGL